METKLIEEDDVFAKLPEDVILHLAPYIDYMDMYCLSEVSNHLSEIFLRIKYRVISLSCDFRITDANFEQVFLNRPSFDSVKELDLSGLSWLPKENLLRVIFYFKFVEKVNVVGTKINYFSSSILRKLQKSKILTITYSHTESDIVELLRETSSENFIRSMAPLCEFNCNAFDVTMRRHPICVHGFCYFRPYEEVKTEGIKNKIINMLKSMAGKAVRWRM